MKTDGRVVNETMLDFRAVDTRTGRVLCEAATLASLYPESEQDWAAREQRVDGTWVRVPQMRRSPSGEWL